MWRRSLRAIGPPPRRTGNSRRREGAHVVSGWWGKGVVTRRIEQLEIDEPIPLLSASEIGAFTYCPEAWVLDRLQTPRTSAGQQRVRGGTSSHRRVGRGVDRLSAVDGASRLAALTIVLLALFVALQLAGVIQVPHP